MRFFGNRLNSLNDLWTPTADRQQSPYAITKQSLSIITHTACSPTA
jgi:hypothetical protein